MTCIDLNKNQQSHNQLKSYKTVFLAGSKLIHILEKNSVIFFFEKINQYTKSKTNTISITASKIAVQ